MSHLNTNSLRNKFEFIKEFFFNSIDVLFLSETKLQSRTRYLRQTVIFLCEIAHYVKNSISIFKECCASIDKIFILEGKMSTWL